MSFINRKKHIFAQIILLAIVCEFLLPSMAFCGHFHIHEKGEEVSQLRSDSGCCEDSSPCDDNSETKKNHCDDNNCQCRCCFKVLQKTSQFDVENILQQHPFHMLESHICELQQPDKVFHPPKHWSHFQGFLSKIKDMNRLTILAGWTVSAGLGR